MRRHCFRMQVALEHLDEYRERHSAVWPEMLRALEATGWHRYSLFLADDGLLIGTVESDLGLDELQAAMAATDVDARWQAEMAPFFVGDSTPVASLEVLDEVFHLDDQLARHQHASTTHEGAS